ncbi:hypothetical protein DKX38_003786 [Salix brachista]|uniref:Uncharacterized protein n=1 Tax=Salix brachista TaxID=2182728 RepID=A0A5N5N9F9_9ROSI|nr:hypothetical protein DKX38_003786 [Salix brachista]
MVLPCVHCSRFEIFPDSSCCLLYPLLSAAVQQARRRLRRFFDLVADVRLIQQHLLKRESSEEGDFARGCCCNKSSREAWGQEAVLFSVVGGGEA